MQTMSNLFDLLKAYLQYLQLNTEGVCFLAYRINLNAWCFYDSTLSTAVWDVHNDPDIIPILRLDAVSASLAINVVEPSRLVDVLINYAVFTSTRPALTGLQHFIMVPKPDSLMSGPQTVNPETVQ